MIPHEESNIQPAVPQIAFKVLRPERIPFISYPYEWCFSQLKDAALLTLDLQKRALARGMTLKDASATNIQFHSSRPVFIDSLSFEAYQEGQPWVPYRQFCQHFLATLALMAYKDIRLNQLLRVYIDGIPLDLASRLLPDRTRFNVGLLTHIHIHAGAQKRFAGRAVETPPARGVSKLSLLGLIDHLERTVRNLTWKPAGTDWAQYYDETNYIQVAADHKRDLVSRFIAQISAKTLWDLGANTGLYSRLASHKGLFTVAADYDPAAVELNYLQSRRDKDENLLPILIDLTNPSGSSGWANAERQSLAERGPADAVMALALIHHLAIGNNVPLSRIAEYFRGLGEWLIIEFVPKSDSQVQRLLATRKDIFETYHLDGFKDAFAPRYEIVAEEPIRESERTLFLMKRHA
ncbi:MAG: SAM-dependent methyltransferase [Anaerolineales bacterium]